MFVENLTDGEKAAFLGLAKSLVEADEVLSPKETQLLSSLSDAAGVDAAPGSLKELAGAFQTRQSKVSAMLEMMGLGAVIRHVGSKAVRALSGLARSFGKNFKFAEFRDFQRFMLESKEPLVL